MSILGNVGQSAGLDAAKEVHATLDSALGTVDHETIPTAELAAKNILDRAIYGLTGVIADTLNKLNGAELPVDIIASVNISVKVTGVIGALKLNLESPDPTVQPSATVVG